MVTMRLELDQFETEPRPQLHFEPDRARVDAMLEDTEFRAGGEGLRIDLSAQKTDGTIRLRGEIAGQIVFTCGRCMEDQLSEVQTDVEFVLMPREKWQERYEGAEEIELQAEDLDVSFYDGESIDLEPLIREALLLDLPVYAACSEEAREACDEAYAQHVGDETVAKNEENSIDLRWGPLKDIKLSKGDDD